MGESEIQGPSVEVRLRGAEEKGGLLVVAATGVELRGGEIVFHRAGEVVLVQPLPSVEALSWHVPAPNSLSELRKRLPQAYARWTDEERDRLRAEVAAGVQWGEIAGAHGRGLGGVHSEAKRLGLVPADEPVPRRRRAVVAVP